MESSSVEQQLKNLADLQADLLKTVGDHFAYLQSKLKENKGTQLAVNERRRDRIPIELTKYISVYNKDSFIPISPHKVNNLYADITGTIGNTPLVRLQNISELDGLKGEVYLKLEYFNPLNSVKDRIGVSMLDDIIKSGKANSNTTFIEPTSGNTGIGLAFVAAARKYKLILIMPEHLSEERKKMFKLLGAQLVTTPKALGMKGAIEKSKELNTLIPNSLILQQFQNPSNPKIHRLTTAEELWSDTNGSIDYLVSGVGTGGTITGVGQVIKARKSTFKAIAVEPKNSPVLSGGQPGPHVLQGMGAGFVPPILDTQVYDQIILADDKDALDTMKRVLSAEGIPVGISSGAIIWAAIQLAQREESKGKIIVAIVPSNTERYLSTDAFKDERLVSSDEDEIKSTFAPK